VNSNPAGLYSKMLSQRKRKRRKRKKTVTSVGKDVE
jgi:hypothetical protein